jgi:hypothetical protein
MKLGLETPNLAEPCSLQRLEGRIYFLTLPSWWPWAFLSIAISLQSLYHTISFSPVSVWSPLPRSYVDTVIGFRIIG